MLEKEARLKWVEDWMSGQEVETVSVDVVWEVVLRREADEGRRGLF